MIDKNIKKKKASRTLAFKYNSLGKPVEIKMEKVGKINVAYDNYGDIKKVESKQGHKRALQVTSAFQNLLSIVKPAGVNQLLRLNSRHRKHRTWYWSTRWKQLLET